MSLVVVLEPVNEVSEHKQARQVVHPGSAPAAWLIATGRVEEEVTGDVVSEPVANVEDVPDVVVVVAVEVEDGIEECCDDEEAVTLVLGACCESKDGPLHIHIKNTILAFRHEPGGEKETHVVAGALTFTLSPNLAPPSKVTFDTS